MDIGTGKDIVDYTVNGVAVPYHLIDIVDAGYKYNVYEFQKDFFAAFNQITNKGKLPILCGGTGLYIESVVKSYNLQEVPINQPLRDKLEDKTIDELTGVLASFKKPHNKSDFDSKKRTIRAIEIETYNQENQIKITDFESINSLLIGIQYDRDFRRERITERLKSRLKSGMIEEVENLLKNGVEKETLLYYGLEYRYITLYITGEISYNEMYRQLEIAIHQFAKRQMTWFRGMERRGLNIHWFDGNMPMNDKLQQIVSLVNKEKS